MSSSLINSPKLNGNNGSPNNINQGSPKSISPTTKKMERKEFIDRLIKELDSINKSNDLILGGIPLQIEDSYKTVTSLLNNLEDLRPTSQKSFSKSNLKIMELEKSIALIKTKIRDNQIKKNNIQLQKEFEKELELKLIELDELTRKFQNSLIQNNQQQQQQQQQQQKVNNSNNISNDRQNLFKLIKSNLSNLQISNQRIYQLNNSYYTTLKGYFNLLVEISNRIPSMRGGIDIAGVISIGQDEATEILERMCDSIYESSKIVFTFINELPQFEKQWYSYHYKLFEKVMDRASDDSFDDSSSSGSGSNKKGGSGGKKQQTDKNKGILNVFKLFKGSSYRQSVNLLEKIEAMEYENEIQQKLNQNLLANTSQIYNSHKSYNNNNNSNYGHGDIKKQIVYEPLNSSFTMMDALVLDLQNLLSFPESEIINHIDSLANKCQMLFDTFNLLKVRYLYFKEKLTRWIDNNSTIIRVASYECDSQAFKIPDFKTVPDIQYKVKVLYKVMHSYFTCCLIATPMVYLSPDSWKLSNHSDYRQEKRAQIDKLLLVLKSNYPIDYDVLRKLILEFTDILISALDIQIPLMLEVYEDDSTLTKRKNWSHERKLLKDTISNSINQLKYYQNTNNTSPNSLSNSNSNNNNNNNTQYQELLGSSVKMLQGVMLEFFKFKPIGRPHLYKNDHSMKLISESKKRYDYRTSILI